MKNKKTEEAVEAKVGPARPPPSARWRARARAPAPANERCPVCALCGRPRETGGRVSSSLILTIPFHFTLKCCSLSLLYPSSSVTRRTIHLTWY